MIRSSSRRSDEAIQQVVFDGQDFGGGGCHDGTLPVGCIRPSAARGSDLIEINRKSHYMCCIERILAVACGVNMVPLLNYIDKPHRCWRD